MKPFLIALLLFLTPLHAQVAESDTDTFLNTHFHLQDTYTRVLCVAQDGTCPAEITTAVPCLTMACIHPEQTYPVSETHETIQAAADSAQPGDLIIIMPGRYAGISLEGTGGQDSAYIHFLGWGEPGSVVIDSSADPTQDWLRHHFYLIDVRYYMFQNLAFEGAADGAGFFVAGFFSATGRFSHHIVVMNVYSHDNGVWGLHTTATSYLVIQDSMFTNAQDEHGIYISGSGDHVLIRRNVFQGNLSSGVQVNADPLTATSELFYWLETATGDTCGLSEESLWQEVKACYDSQNLPDLGIMIEDGVSERIFIEQNVITGNGSLGAAGVNLASVRNAIVRNNLIYGNFAAGITCWDDGYAENHGLDSSEFGCANVRIVNNTLVDETGGRGALILSNDARDMQVYNNIIVRDRFDAYEITNRSRVESGWNYYFARSADADAGEEVNSITGFSVADALAQFVNPTFEPWVLEGSPWPELNPSRPDYHPKPDSLLLTAGSPDFAPALDVTGSPRTGTEIGAYAAP